MLLRSFARGNPSAPALGMQAMPDQLAARLRPDSLHLGVFVGAIQQGYVDTDAGRVAARAVVCATDPEAAWGFALPGASMRSLTTWWWAVDEPPTTATCCTSTRSAVAAGQLGGDDERGAVVRLRRAGAGRGHRGRLPRRVRGRGPPARRSPPRRRPEPLGAAAHRQDLARAAPPPGGSVPAPAHGHGRWPVRVWRPPRHPVDPGRARLRPARGQRSPGRAFRCPRRWGSPVDFGLGSPLEGPISTGLPRSRPHSRTSRRSASFATGTYGAAR